MPNIKTVKPAGGGDYTTLQAWEDFAGDEDSPDQWAECYSGGNLGFVLLAGSSWAASTALLYPRIYVADGEGHNGSQSSGAIIELTGIQGHGVQVQVNYCRVEGLRISCESTNSSGVIVTGENTNASIINMMIYGSSSATRSGIAFSIANGFTSSGHIAKNCVVDLPNMSGNNTGILLALLTSGTLEVSLFNCSIINHGGLAGIGIAANGTVTINATIENCISVTTPTNFLTQSFGGTPTFNTTANNNLSSDATADDFGGTGHVINETDTDVFIDPANDSFFLKDGSAAIATGKDLSADFTTDAVGHPHNVDIDGNAVAFNMGALATYPFVATIKPAGGGDYTTLAAWEDAVDFGPSAFQWAECYTGGDLGVCAIRNFGVSSAIGYVRIYVADGEEHGGDESAGAFIALSSGEGIMSDTERYLRVEGLRFDCTGTSTGIWSHDTGPNENGPGAFDTFDNLLFHGSTTGLAGIRIGDDTSNQRVGVNAVVRNCIINLPSADTGINIGTKTGTADTNLAGVVQNCTINGPAIGIRWNARFAGAGLVITTLVENTIVVDASTGCFIQDGFNSAADEQMTLNNCLSSDATADDWNGSNNLVNQIIGDVLNNYASGDMTLKPGSSARNNGKDIAGLTVDILGVTRPPGSYDIGAYEADKAFADVIHYITASPNPSENDAGIRVGSAGIVTPEHRRARANNNSEADNLANRLDDRLTKEYGTSYGEY